MVTYRPAGIHGYLAEWETHEYDADTGEHISFGPLCQLAGRELEGHEWASFVGEDVAQEELCP
jgi:hypothetical protein